MILDRIMAVKQEDLTARRSRIPLNEQKEAAYAAPPARDFAGSLARGECLAVIAEHKRASPSKGVIRSDLRLADVIDEYTRGGAAAISVLTEECFFLGRDEDLRETRRMTNLPILRKDFLFDVYQIWEARALGADAVLLIAALLDDSHLRDLLALTRELGMEALVEAHTPGELMQAVTAGARIIGINNRNLNSFQTTLETGLQLARAVPADRLLVAESGIANSNDVRQLAAVGFDGVLVGESLMRADQPATLLSELAACRRHRTIRLKQRRVKICGITSIADGLQAADAGADILGVVFGPSPRRVETGFASALRRELGEKYPGVQLAGVFVDSLPVDIYDTVKEVGLDIVQLHGDESPEQVAELAGLRDNSKRFLIFKAFAVGDGGIVDDISPYTKYVDGVLLDAPSSSTARGGNGKAFNWRLASLVRCHYPHTALGLAGGLRVGNVGEAIRLANPDLVDVCSGVEKPGHPGIKEPRLVKEFIQATRKS